MPRYDQVDWTIAACKGTPTNLFYVFEEHRKPQEFFNVSIVKKICYTCPIWRACLVYGMNEEIYGVWGGLTTHERKALVSGEPSSLFSKVAQELLDNGISIGEIQEVISEYSRDERSLENQASYE